MEIKILPERCFALQPGLFQKLPRRGVSRITFREQPVGAFRERLPDHCGQSFTGISLSLIAFIDDITDFLRFEIPVSAVNIFDDFSGIRKFDRVEFFGAQTVFQMFPAVFISDAG